MKALVVGLATFEEMQGGSARYLSGITANLRTRGHHVEVRTGRGALGGRWLAPGRRDRVARMLHRLVAGYPRQALAVARTRPDVLYAHFALESVAAVLAARLLRVPIVVTFHGPWAGEAASLARGRSHATTNTIRRAVETLVYRSADRCIAMSDAFGRLLTETYGVPAGRIRVIPPGISVPATPLVDRSDARRHLELPDRPTVVTVRRLVPRMGIDMLLDAFARLPASLDAGLVVGGDGPDRNALEQRARSLGVEGRCRFLGRVADADLAVLYAAADVCILPTRELEGFGYVALEAYASGTPVVATAVGGLVELVGGFDPAALVPPTVDGLLAGMTAALTGTPPSRDACRAYAARYDWAAIGARVEAVLGEAVRRR